MLFKDYHIPMIRSGSKTATRREWSDDYHPPKAGSVVAATTKLFVPDEKAGCYIKIQAVYDQPLGDMDDADARMEGDYEDLEEFRDAYEDVYGDGAWDPEKVVTVVEFQYVGKERPLLADGGQDVERVAQQIVELCDHDPPDRVEDPHPKLFTDMEGERVDSALFKLWQKGVLDAEWDEDAEETRWWLTHFGVGLNERGLVRPYIHALENEFQIDATPAAMEVLEP